MEHNSVGTLTYAMEPFLLRPGIRIYPNTPACALEPAEGSSGGIPDVSVTCMDTDEYELSDNVRCTDMRLAAVLQDANRVTILACESGLSDALYVLRSSYNRTLVLLTTAAHLADEHCAALAPVVEQRPLAHAICFVGAEVTRQGIIEHSVHGATFLQDSLLIVCSHWAATDSPLPQIAELR